MHWWLGGVHVCLGWNSIIFLYKFCKPWTEYYNFEPTSLNTDKHSGTIKIPKIIGSCKIFFVSLSLYGQIDCWLLKPRVGTVTTQNYYISLIHI